MLDGLDRTKDTGPCLVSLMCEAGPEHAFVLEGTT